MSIHTDIFANYDEPAPVNLIHLAGGDFVIEVGPHKGGASIFLTAAQMRELTTAFLNETMVPANG